MLVFRAALVVAGLLVAASSLLFAAVGIPALFQPQEDGGIGGQILLIAVVLVLLGGGPYVAYLFIRSAFRIPKVGDASRGRLVRIWLMWLAWSALSFMTVPFEFPAGVAVIGGVAFFIIAVASLAQDLEPPPQQQDRARE